MICLLVTQAHRYTIDGFLRGWARPLSRRVTICTYESLSHRAALHAGTFIFTDLERLSPAQCERAERLAMRIAASGGRVLNRPAHVLRRFDLLRALHAAGHNPFNAYRVDGSPPPCRFPVFVREANDHTGALTELLHDHGQLRTALARLRRSSRRFADLLVVEYCDTRAADGRYRKYAAMRVGDRLVPRHLLISKDWVDKYPDIVDDAATREENAFLNTFLHAGDVRRAFDLGGIDYGRIDYSCDPAGRVVTWEINTNPLIVPMPQECNPRRLDAQTWSAQQVTEALAALDGPDVRVSLSGLAPIGSAGRPRDWRGLKSMTLSHTPLARRAIRMLRRTMGSARDQAI